MANIYACEGDARPDALTYPTGPAARFLPAPLIHARAAALDPQHHPEISRIARQALFGILAFFDIRKPGEPVFASRDKICAEALLGSQPTLFRALADLVRHGYIRREQCRRRAKETYGQYSISRIWLEEKALRALGLLPAPGDDPVEAKSSTQDGARTTPSKTYPHPPSITVRDRLQDSELSPTKQLSTKEQPVPPDAIGTAKTQTRESADNAIDRKTHLPLELVRLLELGLSKSRVCALMRLAREHGNGGMLGAVVQLVWDRIRPLHRNAVFAYLAKLVKQRKDYQRMVTIQTQYEDKTRMPRALLERLQAKLPIFLARAEGMVLATRDGKVLGPVQPLGEGGYVEFTDDRGTRRSVPVNARMVEAWEEGNLVLRPAD